MPNCWSFSNYYSRIVRRQILGNEHWATVVTEPSPLGCFPTHPMSSFGLPEQRQWLLWRRREALEHHVDLGLDRRYCAEAMPITHPLAMGSLPFVWKDGKLSMPSENRRPFTECKNSAISIMWKYCKHFPSPHSAVREAELENTKQNRKERKGSVCTLHFNLYFTLNRCFA